MSERGPDDTIRVVAAVIERDGTWLLGRRPAAKRHGGLWEFPGGKLDDGESLLDGARRELAEELELVATDTGDVLFERRDPGSPFVIEFVPVTATGAPKALEHDEIGWFDLEGLAGLALAPADAAFVTWLRGRAVSPDPES